MKKILQAPSANIERLLQHGRYLDYITQRIKTYLPPEFSDIISVVRFDKKTLVISAKSSACASQLRFFIPELKKSLKADPRFEHLGAIKLRVSSHRSEHSKSVPAPLCSNAAAKTLFENAQFIPNEDLKASLLSLSRHIAEKAAYTDKK